MAQYDGSIRIDTRVDTKGLQRGLTSVKGDLGKFKDSIHNGMSALDRGITDIGGKIKKMGSGMRREVSSVRGSVDGLTGSFKKLGATIASVFAVRKIAGMASSMTELGSDLEEVQNVVDVTFTTMSDKINEFAVNAAKSAGLSETMAKRYAGTFGAMSKSFGFTEDAAYQMSTALTQLAGDVASFYNITQDEAYTKLKSVFTGETETLKDLGVVMTENALNSYAMAKGIGKTVSKMTEQQKVALRYQFVLEKLSGASGDFVRTQDSWANQTRILRLQIDSLKATIGQGLINVLTPLLKMLNTLLEKLKQVANAFKSFTESFFGKSQTGGTGSGSKYVDTAEGITGSLEDVSGAAKDAEKSLEGYLSPLDEINKYSTGKDEDLLSGLEDIDFGNLGDLDIDVTVKPEIDESGLSDKFRQMAEKMKDMWEKSDFTDLGKTLGENLKKALDNIPWGKIKKTARKIGRSIATLINGSVEVKKLGYSIGKTLAEAVNTGFEFLNNFVHGLHWDSIGKFIADTLNGFFQSIDWELIYDTFITGAKGLGDAINSFADNLDWDAISSTIANFVNTFVDTVYTFFTTVDWAGLGTRIGDTLTETIKKIDFEKVGRAIGSVIQAAIDFVKNLVSELSFDDIVNAVTDLLSGLFDELGVTFPASFEEFGNLVSDAVIKAFSFIKDTIAGIKWDEIGSSIAEFINGIKWDEVSKAFFDSCTTAINSAIDLVYNFVKDTKWDEIAEEIGNSFNESLKDLDSEKLGRTIGAALQAAIDFLKTFVKTINWKDVVDAIKDALKGFMEEVDMSDVADIILTLLSAKLVIAAGKFAFSSAAAAIMGSIKNALLGSASVEEATATGNAIGASITSGLIAALLDGAVAAAAVVGSYKLLTGHLEELFAAFGKSTDQGERLEKRYEGLDGATRFAKDGIDTLKNGIEGYGFAADNCVGTGVALEKAMEDIQNGAILTDEHMEELQNRFSLTDEDMEMLRQEMLDCNPLLREIADNLGFENASPETLQDIAEGFGMIANGVEPLPDDLANMTEEARGFMERVMESETPMVVFGEKLENIGAISDNTSESLNETGKSISDGLMKGMEEADVETGSENLFSRLIGKIKELFGIHSPSTVMAEIGGFIIEGMLNGIMESLKSIGSWVKEHIFQPFIDGFKNAFDIHSPSGVMENMGEYIIEGLLNGLKNMWGSITSWIEDKISWIIEKFQSVKDKVSGFFSGGSSGDSGQSYSSRTYSMRSLSAPYVHPAIAKLSNIEIPKLATGAVLPANREFLAVVGDQKHGTNVEAPLDTIRQANREAVLGVLSELGITGNLGNGNSQTLIVKLVADGRELTDLVIRNGEVRQMSTGNNPFLLGTT